jgi:hypothetical protein
MTWSVRLSSTPEVLEELSQSVNLSNVRIVKTDKGYSLESDRFVGPAAQVRSDAEELVGLIIGATRLAMGVESDISIKAVVKLNADGSRDEFLEMADHAMLHDSLTITTVSQLDGSVRVICRTDPIPKWIDVALADPSVAKVLRLQSLPIDWVNLYRILEVIQADVGGSKPIRDNGWATKTALDRFEHSTNDPSTSGDQSRHGHRNIKPPANPMHFE